MHAKKKTNNFKAIIWDWNGTLLDDVDYSVACINHMLKIRDLEPLDVDKYRNKFTFPVKRYYEKIGFNFKSERWEEVAMEFMHHYWEGLDQLKLFRGVEDVLNEFAGKGMRQFVISAMEHDKLSEMIRDRSLTPFFEQIYGIHNHFAESKAHLAMELLKSYDIKPEEALWVGDTVHDFEIADSIGIHSLLMSTGHQSKNILKATNGFVCDNLMEISTYCVE